MADGIFIKVLPQLEMAAFASVMGQLRATMGKAGADMSKSFDGPQKALEALNAETVKTSNAVAAASEKMDALQVKAQRSAEARANAEATSSERQVKAAADVEAAELRLDATRSRNFASQENRMASLAAAQNRLDAAIARSEQIQRDEALNTAKALDAEQAALGRLAVQEETLTAARAAHTATLAKQTDALAASSTVMAKYGGAMDTAGMAAAGAFAIIGGVGLDAATKFETGMTRIQVAGQVPLEQVQKLSQGLLDMSSQMGVSMSKLQEASLMISKSGPQYKDAADNLGILRAGIELSKTEGADLTTVVQQMTTSMNDFSMGSNAAGDVAAKFQAAAANAKRPLEEFVGALHNIEPAAMGVLDNKTGLNQVLTVMSQMAGTGAGIDQASQNLNNFLSHLNVPNSPQRSVLGALGIDSTALSEQLRSPNGLITVLGELRAALQGVTTGSGDSAITHLGDAFKNPQVTALMQRDYEKLSPSQQNLADRFVQANNAGIMVDKDTMRQQRAASGTSGLFKDWYTKFLQTTGPSNLIKAGIDPNMSPAMAIQYATGSQAGDRSFLGLMGDITNPQDEHWKNTQDTYKNTTNASADNKGDIPGWSDVLKTNKQKLDELNGSLQKLAIEVGQDILPAFKEFIDTLTGATKFLGDHKGIVDALVGSLGVLATGWLAVKSAMALSSVFTTITNGIELAIGKFTTLGNVAKATAAEEEIASVAGAGSIGKVTAAAGGAASKIESIGTSAARAAGPLALIASIGYEIADAYGKAHPFLDNPAYSGTMRDQFRNGTPQEKRDVIYNESGRAMRGFGGKAGSGPGGPGTTRDLQAPSPTGAATDDIANSNDFLTTPKMVADEVQRRLNASGVGSVPPNAVTPGATGAPGGPNDSPTGTTSDPVQVQIPGFDPGQYASDMGSGMGLDMGLDGSDLSGMGGMGAGIENPLEQIKGGGFTLPNIAKVLTTFLMEMALGNPLGHLLTGTNEFGGDGQGSGDPTADIGDIDKMTAGQRKQAEYELQTQAALARYKKAQAAYVKAITKYGKGSEQGISAYANLLSAKDNVEGVALRQTDAIQNGSAALSAAQATVQQDQADMINISDPSKYQSDLAKLTKIQNSLPSGGTARGSDAALLAGIPSGGQYVHPGGTFDLSKGLADCSSAVGDLVKTIDGQSTGGSDRLTTGNASTWLPARGFLPNNTGANIPGAFNVGYNDSHMQATLPGGTNFNWGSDSAAAARGINGGGAFDATGGGTGPFTSHYYLPMNGSGPAASTPASADPYSAANTNPALNNPGGGSGGGSILQNLMSQFLPGGGEGPVFKHNGGDGSGGGAPGVPGTTLFAPGGPLGASPPMPPGAAGTFGNVGMPPGTPGSQTRGFNPLNALAPTGGPNVGVGAGAGRASGAFGGPVTPSNTAGPIQSGSGPGVSVGGGMLGTAESLASTALNAIAPGAGIAAQIGMQELNNVASYVGKAAGIGIEGLQETFAIHSPDTDDGTKNSGGWIGKIAGGLAGGHPTSQNSAGTAKPVDPKDQPKDPKQSGAGTVNNYNVTNNNHGVNDAQGVATKTNQGLMQYPTQ